VSKQAIKQGSEEVRKLDGKKARKHLAGVKPNGVAGVWRVLVGAGVQDIVESVGQYGHADDKKAVI
jgi:hypothetical protein